jgi:hypothetical protein
MAAFNVSKANTQSKANPQQDFGTGFLSQPPSQRAKEQISSRPLAMLFS